jgi:hypothetical protein
MKKNIILLGMIGCVVSLIYSCNKGLVTNAPTVSPAGSAFIKVIDFAPSFRLVTNNRDSFNVFVNNIKINGSFLTYNSSYPSSVNDTYAAVPPGPQTIRLSVNGVNTPDSITLATLTKTVNAGEYYTFIITDSLLNSVDAKQIWTKDLPALTDTGHFNLRFIHAVVNDTTGKNVDIYSTRYLTNIYSNVAPTTVTPFAPQAYTLLTDTLIVRRAGTLFELGRLNSASFARQRAYTLVYKGNGNLTSASTKGRVLTTYINQ